MDSRQPAQVWSVGRFILEEAQARRLGPMQRASLLYCLGWRAHTLTELIGGDRPLTPSEAADLARVFGTSPDYWANLDRAWQEATPEQRRAPRDFGGREVEE